MASKNSAKKTPKQLASESQEAQIGSVRQILSNLFRRMLHQTGKADSWEYLMAKYVEDPTNNVPDHNAMRSSARWNLQKTILDDYMSWRAFCKGMRFLRLLKFKVIVEAYYLDGEQQLRFTRTESPLVDLNMMASEDLDLDDEAFKSAQQSFSGRDDAVEPGDNTTGS